jgi:hypothetical protein
MDTTIEIELLKMVLNFDALRMPSNKPSLITN